MMSDVLKGIHLQYAYCKSFHGENNALIFVGKILAETKNLNILQKKIYTCTALEKIQDLTDGQLCRDALADGQHEGLEKKKSLPELGSYNLTEQDLSSIPLKLMYLRCCKKII